MDRAQEQTIYPKKTLKTSSDHGQFSVVLAFTMFLGHVVDLDRKSV